MVEQKDWTTMHNPQQCRWIQEDGREEWCCCNWILQSKFVFYHEIWCLNTKANLILVLSIYHCLAINVNQSAGLKGKLKVLTVISFDVKILNYEGYHQQNWVDCFPTKTLFSRLKWNEKNWNQQTGKLFCQWFIMKKL